MNRSLYISVTDIADQLGCSRMTVLRLIKAGEISAHRYQGTKLWVDKNELALYVAKKRIEAAKAAKAAHDLRQLKLDFFEP